MKKLLRIITSRALLTAVLMVIQFTLLIMLLLYGIGNSWMYSIVSLATSFIFGFYILNHSTMHTAYKLAWMTLVLAIPVLGVFAYIVLGRSGNKNHRLKRYSRYAVQLTRYLGSQEQIMDILKERDGFYAHATNYVNNSISYPSVVCNDVTYFSSGEELLTPLKQALSKAEKYIFMEYFIIDEGIFWSDLLAVLRERIAHGVDVRLIYDDFGTFLTLTTRARKALKEYGIKTMVFNRFRPFLDMSQNNRTHRKFTVIDGNVAFTGGINIADEYINAVNRYGYWKDTAVMVKGAVAESFTAMFLQTWSYRNQEPDYSIYFTAHAPEEERGNFAQAFTDVPIDTDATCENLYIKLLYNAKKYVTMTTPYLIISDELKRAIVTAVNSGVEVRIIVPHVADKKTVFWLTKAFYTDLVKKGVKVYEYLPGFIHAKMIVSDDEYAIVGTSNMDFRSFYLHYEDGIFFKNHSLASEIKADLDDTANKSLLMTEENTKVHLFMRLVRGILRIFAPLM